MWSLESEKKCDYWTLKTKSVRALQLDRYLDIIRKLNEYDFAWNLICVEVLLETGSVVCYPSKAFGGVRDEPVLFKIIFAELIDKYEKIEPILGQSEEAFEAEYDKAIDEVVEVLSEKLPYVLTQKDIRADVIIVDPDMEVLFDSKISGVSNK